MIESEPLRYIAAVGGMTLAAYATRIGGYWLIGHVPIGARLRRMLDALPGAVIAPSCRRSCSRADRPPCWRSRRRLWRWRAFVTISSR